MFHFFSFDACAFDVRPKKPLPDLWSRKCTPVSKDFKVLVFIFVFALLKIFFKFLFILVVLGLDERAFLQLQRVGLLSSCSVRASHFNSFSCCGAQAVGHAGFSSCSSQDLEHKLNSCGSWAELLLSLWKSSQTRDRTHVSCTGRKNLYH